MEEKKQNEISLSEKIFVLISTGLFGMIFGLGMYILYQLVGYGFWGSICIAFFCSSLIGFLYALLYFGFKSQKLNNRRLKNANNKRISTKIRTKRNEKHSRPRRSRYKPKHN